MFINKKNPVVLAVQQGTHPGGHILKVGYGHRRLNGLEQGLLVQLNEKQGDSHVAAGSHHAGGCRDGCLVAGIL